MTARLGLAVATMVLMVSLHSVAQAPAPAVRDALDVFFLDTEGGQATLLVTPSRESMLIDTGFAGGRDADRIIAAMKLAGIAVLDYVVITHYHGDQVGGAAELAARVPIRHFIDHGPYTVELQ
ncbi:MAG: MBL fold metallo-hydrolase, partial [Vicinamibacterales bacterium]